MKKRVPQFKSIDPTPGAVQRSRNLRLFLGIIGLPPLVLVYMGHSVEAFLWMVIAAAILAWTRTTTVADEAGSVYRRDYGIRPRAMKNQRLGTIGADGRSTHFHPKRGGHVCDREIRVA